MRIETSFTSKAGTFNSPEDLRKKLQQDLDQASADLYRQMKPLIMEDSRREVLSGTSIWTRAYYEAYGEMKRFYEQPKHQYTRVSFPGEIKVYNVSEAIEHVRAKLRELFRGLDTKEARYWLDCHDELNKLL